MTVCIIGGGASGMAAAITAASNGHRVILLERQARVGRKLLATGNGRCNLSNTHADTPGHYHGADPRFSDYALGRPDLNVSATLDWFASLGLLTTAEDSGRLYPYSNMAGSVLDALRFALEGLGVDVRTGCTVTGIRVRDNALTVVAGEESIRADAVILAAGGAAGGKVGGVMDGYRLAKELGHHRTALCPAVVQLRTDPTYPRSLKGVKAQASVRILRGEETLAESTGELLFTEYGVSGPAVFDVSRAVSTGGDGLVCRLDFLPEWDDGETLDWLCRRRDALAGREAQTLLTGLFHTRLGQVICKASGFTAQSAESLTDADLRRIVRSIHRFSLPVVGTCGFDQAQVTAGGLRTDEFDPRTMQSRLVPGFYACGEVLDVDGDCGGYNLQWAWSSGRLAGMLG
jgi:predicted Rossmann fold flavoprotein